MMMTIDQAAVGLLSPDGSEQFVAESALTLAISIAALRSEWLIRGANMRPTRMLFILAIAIVCAASSELRAQQSGREFGQSSQRQFGARTVDLETQLRNGLRVARPEQVAFVKVVVLYTEKERLPQAMVNLVYKWSLEKNSRIPFPYFQFAMRELAKRRGVILP